MRSTLVVRRLGNMLILGIALLFLVVAIVFFSHGASPAGATQTQTKPPAEMRLVVVEPANACVADKCQIGIGETFTLGVEIVRGPSAVGPQCNGNGCSSGTAAGYVLAQTSVFYGSDITYDFSPSAADEIVWPDCDPAVALKSQVDRRLPLPIAPDVINTDELVSHGCITGTVSPQLSEFTGVYLELVMSCSSQSSSSEVRLLPYTLPSEATAETIAGSFGALFVRESVALVDNVFTLNVDPLVSNLTVNCVDVAAPAAVGGLVLDSGLRGIATQDGGAPWLWTALGLGVIAALSALAIAQRRFAPR